MDKDKITNYLKIAMLTGFLVDAIMDIILIIPFLRVIIFEENPQYHTPQYQWAMYVLGSIGAAWTILCLWASRKPFERKDILLISVCPLLIGSSASTVYGFITNAVSLRFFIIFTIISIVHAPWFLFIWIKAKKAEKQS